MTTTTTKRILQTHIRANDRSGLLRCPHEQGSLFSCKTPEGLFHLCEMFSFATENSQVSRFSILKSFDQKHLKSKKV